MIELKTWAGRSNFNYKGSVGQGTEIHFGNGHIINISAGQYKHLLKVFAGKVTNIGTSRTSPPDGSVGEWLVNNVSRVATASYVGAILIYEGYAEKIGGPDIKFKIL